MLTIETLEQTRASDFGVYQPQDFDNYEPDKVQLVQPRRWYPLRYHAKQVAFEFSQRRFNVCPSGRRSGKTERMKRRGIRKALTRNRFDEGRFIFAAPTYAQAKRIYWSDIKAMIPRELLRGEPSESGLTIRLVNNAEISVVGMDKPERIEGSPLEWIGLDEYGDMKPEAWTEHIRPALADRRGEADFIGAPEGIGHYSDLAEEAQSGRSPEWDYFHWPSTDILPPEEIASLRAGLDELSYAQEILGQFVSFKGLAYYNFNTTVHSVDAPRSTAPRHKYDPNALLVFAFDFNVAPGCATVLQESDRGTHVIGEVRIERNSTTPMVCEKLIAEWGQHQGLVGCWGDATGGAGGSAKVMGSDWDLIRACMRPAFPGRVQFHVRGSNPKERVRVNSVNSRLMSTSGSVKLFFQNCPHTVKDFQRVRTLDGSNGVIDKSDGSVTHLSDSVGYYIVDRWPLVSRYGLEVKVAS